MKKIRTEKRTIVSTTTTTTVDETSVEECGGTSHAETVNSPHRISPAATQWTKLNAFVIAAVSMPPPPVRPGRAEVRVRVVLSAVTAANDFIPLPDDELKALLTLVNYDNGEALPGVTMEYDSAGSTIGANSQSIDFWVECADPCGAQLYAAASILPPGAQKPIQTRPSVDHTFNSKVRLPSLVNPLWEITTFELERVSGSDMVFVNGLQQIKVKVELAFTDQTTGRPGVPTKEELESLTIAFSDDGTSLPIDSGSNTWWVTSPGVSGANDRTYDKGYLPHPGLSEPVATRVPVSPDASTFRYFYIACRGGSPQKTSLCAYVKCRDGWVYRTNEIYSDPCGGEYVGKNSQIDVYGVPPEVGALGQYPWVRDVLYGDADGIDEQVKVSNPNSVHRYSLSFVDKGGKQVGLRSLVVEPAGMIQWHDRGTGNLNACFTGYAMPGSTELIWNDVGEVPVGEELPLPTLPSADTTKAVIVLVGRRDIAYQPGAPNGPLALHTTDAYGNANTLHVRFDSEYGDGRWKLVLY